MLSLITTMSTVSIMNYETVHSAYSVTQLLSYAYFWLIAQLSHSVTQGPSLFLGFCANPNTRTPLPPALLYRVEFYFVY